MLGSFLLRHRRRKLAISVFKKVPTFFCFVLLWNVICFSMLNPGQYIFAEKCELTTQHSWLSRRSQLFTATWGDSHKLRNAVIYTCIGSRSLPFVSSVVYHALLCPDVIYHPLYSELFSVPSVCVTHSCLKPFGSSHYVYAEFVTKTYASITSKTIKPPKASPNGNIAVLLEPRMHPLYEYAVKQVMLTLGPSWSLQLFVSSENEIFVRKLLDVRSGGAGENIILQHLRDFGLDEMSTYGNRVQSAFSAHSKMYESVPSEHILWFQTDVILRTPPDHRWLRHAYVGSEWKDCQFPTCLREFCSRICGGGNSGLSLRRKSLLLRVATPGALPQELWGSANNSEYFSSDSLHDNSRHLWFEDDLQLSYKLSVLGLLPPVEIPPNFAISEALPTRGLCENTPSGMHKPWSTPWIPPLAISFLLQEPYNKCNITTREADLLDVP